MTSPNSFDGKVIMITGASSGIGRAAALRFAAAGAKVILVARSRDKLEALCRSIGQDRAMAAPADLSVPEDVDSILPRVLNGFAERIDVLLANAGVYIPGEVRDGRPEEWERMIAVNVSSVFRLAHAVLPGMIAARSGDIIVTSSIAGHQSMKLEPTYSATKHAVQSFVHALRRQVAADGLRVGSIAPGTVLNELWGYTNPAAIQEKVDAREGLRSEDVAEAIEFMLTRPRNVAIRDLVMLPQAQDI